MTLDILITHYNEPFEVVKPLLDSIQIQRNVNFKDIGIIIVNDGSKNELISKNLIAYKYNIKLLTQEHSGVSNARNKALDNSNANYVMFCDCDDSFYNVNSLNMILHYLENNPDIVVNDFYEEVIRNNSVYVLKHKNDEVFIHGKVYSRNYLIDNNLRFNSKLTVHEDYYFNKLCLTLTENKIVIDEPMYLWCSRPDSICRKDKDYLQKTYVNLIDVNDCLLTDFINRGLLNETVKTFVQFTFNTYFDLISAKWECSQYFEPTRKYFKDFFVKYRKYYDVCYVKDKSMWYNSYRTKAVNEGMLFEPISFLEWINNLLKEN